MYNLEYYKKILLFFHYNPKKSIFKYFGINVSKIPVMILYIFETVLLIFNKMIVCKYPLYRCTSHEKV